MTKPMYSTRPLKNGGYFDLVIVPDDFVPAYPITDTPIPEALKADGCVPKYQWETATWIDASEDAKAAAEIKRDQDLAAAQAKADGADTKATTAQTTAETAAGAVTELMDYVSTLPTTTATDTTNTEETTNA